MPDSGSWFSINLAGRRGFLFFVTSAEEYASVHAKYAGDKTHEQNAFSNENSRGIAPRRESAYLVAKEPYWVTHKWSSSLSPLPEGFGARLLPSGWRHRLLRKKLDAQIGELVISNVENLRWATLQNLDVSFRRLTGDLDERLRMTIEATRGAIHAAIEKRRKHAESIAEDVRSLQTLTQKVDALIGQLAAFHDTPSATQNPSGGLPS